MKPLLAPLKLAVRGALTVALASGVLALPSAAAGTAAYYAATEITPPADAAQFAIFRAIAVNDQGTVLVADTQGHDPRAYIYQGGQLINLPYAGTNVVGSPSLTSLSNTAADGSCNVVGEADISDGFHRVLYWHVLANGASTVQVMQNRILPPDSQQPGEQHSASATAVNSAGVIAGNVQSYLAGLGAFWSPPDIVPHSDGFAVYEGPSDLDEQGNFCGTHSGTAGYNTAEYNHQDLVLPDNIDSRAYRLKNGLIVGEYVTPAPDYKDVQFVYNLAANTFRTLPLLDSSKNASNQEVKILGAHGELAGTANGDSAVYTEQAIWLPDPATGAYAVYNLQNDIIGPVYTGYDITTPGRYASTVAGFAADGSFVVNGLINRYADNGASQNHILIFKPGADPRSKINVPADSAFSNEIILTAKPGQPFRYQFTATNNPTAFRLLDTSDKTKDATLPAGLSFDATTGVLSGTPTDIANFYFTTQATNGQGIGVLTTFSILTVGSAPMITSASTASGHLNQPFSFQVTATNTPTNFQFTGLPDGLTYDGGSGLISGTSTKAGTFPVAETVDNAVSGGFGGTPSGTGTLTIAIDDKPPAAFSVSLIKPADDQNVVAGTAIVAKAKVDLTNAGTETVASVGFLLDGQPVGATLTAKPYKSIVALDGSLNGVHLLTAVATANDGRTAVSAPLRLNVAARFVDLAGSGSLALKLAANGKINIKGQYSLSNLGNTASGPFRIGFYVSDDTTFDSGDVSLDTLVTQAVGTNPGFSKTISGLPASTTLNSTDLATILPKLKVPFSPDLFPLLTRLQGKYLLVVIDPENTADETADTRGNNVIVFQIPTTLP